jgi:hypothetical protein
MKMEYLHRKKIFLKKYKSQFPTNKISSEEIEKKIIFKNKKKRN